MVLSTDDIMEACRLVAREDDLKLCVYESMKGAGITGAVAFVGGMILGPVGLAIGGAVGGLVAASTSNSYTPLIHHLDSMTDEDKQRLKLHLVDVITKLEITDGIMLLALVSSPGGLARQAITKGMGSFFGQTW